MRRLISITLTAILLLAAVPVAMGLLQEFSRSHGAAASASLTCSVKPSCGEGEVAVFRMSGLANAHAQTAETHPVTYGYEVCCSGPAGLSTAATGCYGTVLSLSAADNAHVASDESYGTKATLSAPDTAVDCVYGTTCDAGYACLATIFSTSNSHVADCDGSGDYATKVCCRARADVNTDAAIDNGPGVPGDDTTIPNAIADSEGDACESDGDIDNDTLPDSEDSNPLGGSGICAAFVGASDGHPSPAGGDVTDDDNHNGDPALATGADASDNGPSWDTDNDGALDGVECTLGTNPRSRAHKPTATQCGGTADMDGDGLLDAWEACGWGTDPSVVDSDGDTRGDCKEAADVDGNSLVNFVGDTIYYAKAILLPPASFGKTMDFDIDKNGIVTFVGDVIQEAKFALITGLCK